ncbi:hypothetical protein BP5796_11064 [Coleophoma crateriformis]|uniref:Arginyl-tRNA--protein transferase 1 n=1 Tax=Coleophoma crateriformis TaxID=565419 RepID=A0A3D8QLS8_9HELO|nr:hypothetical protein BP5796_11064 [Coleophoma crateriformis]
MPKPGYSYYASTKSLTAECYQSLLNRGWRRSGTTLYKPDQLASCCPQYTIRLDSHGFHASKDQRQSLNRFSRFVQGDEYIKEVTRLYPLSKEQAKKRKTDFDLVERTHESENTQLRTPPTPAHKFEVTLESNDYTEEKYKVFENYQRVVHHEPPTRISRSGFKSFLCVSPICKSTRDFNGQVQNLGSYHQCYRLDGKLIAVGVLDLLPQCVSAVYFMYDESVHQLNFGKIGALREIALAKEEGYQWWYAGFYIHSCIKMRYKGDYAPQYMLDPDSYGWDLLDDRLKAKLDKKEFVGLSRARTKDIQETTAVSNEERLAKDEKEQVENGSDTDSATPDLSTPLFARSMPGILSRSQLETDIDLNHIKLRIRNHDAETCDLMAWEDESIDNPQCLKGIIAELVSAVGPEIAREMIVTF